MRRESHVRFCEGGGVRFPSATRRIWERRDGRGYSVTFPARPFNVYGDRTNFALLRAIGDPKAQNQVRELLIRAYAEHDRHAAETAS
jgi:hypothetical protein